jgi:hypothetical protein
VSWFDSLERDRENLRSALRWCIDRTETEPGLRMAGALTDSGWCVDRIGRCAACSPSS